MMKMDEWIDILGNKIRHIGGKGKKLMLIAHADTVAMMVTYIDERGFINVKPAGGIDVNMLPCRCVSISHDGQDVIGVIGKRPIHLQRPENDGKISWEDIWIDIGSTSKEETLQKVSIGDNAYYSSQSVELSNGLITDKGLDDACGLQVLRNIGEQLVPEELAYDLYLVESNYEEIGMRGAMVAANEISPDFCIAIDATHATDYPGMNPIREGDVKVGGGCVLAIGPNVDKGLYTRLRSIAENKGMSYQIEPSPYPTGTDANIIQVTGRGVRTAVVSIPCRYMHTPQEIISTKDIESATSLILNFLQRTN